MEGTLIEQLEGLRSLIHYHYTVCDMNDIGEDEINEWINKMIEVNND